MKPDELLAEADKAMRNRAQLSVLSLRHKMETCRALADLVPDLTRHLKRAVNGLRAANANREHVDKYHGYDGGRCPSNCPAKIVKDTLHDIGDPPTLRERLRDIEEPPN